MKPKSFIFISIALLTVTSLFGCAGDGGGQTSVESASSESLSQPSAVISSLPDVVSQSDVSTVLTEADAKTIAENVMPGYRFFMSVHYNLIAMNYDIQVTINGTIYIALEDFQSKDSLIQYANEYFSDSFIINQIESWFGGDSPKLVEQNERLYISSGEGTFGGSTALDINSLSYEVTSEGNLTLKLFDYDDKVNRIIEDSWCNIGLVKQNNEWVINSIGLGNISEENAALFQ